MDACFSAIDRITGRGVTLKEYQLNAATAEKGEPWASPESRSSAMGLLRRGKAPAPTWWRPACAPTSAR